MVTVPVPVNVETRPASLIVAISVLDELQVMEVVRSRVVASP